MYKYMYYISLSIALKVSLGDPNGVLSLANKQY